MNGGGGIHGGQLEDGKKENVLIVFYVLLLVFVYCVFGSAVLARGLKSQ